MKSNGILVKLDGSAASHRAVLAAALPADHEIRPLFTLAAEPPSRKRGAKVAATAARQHTWVLVRLRTDGVAAQAAVQHPWDAAHDMRRQLLAKGAAVLTAEPDLEQAWLPVAPGGEAPAMRARAEDPTEPADQIASPYVPGPRPDWHLDDEFTQLRAAREATAGAAPSAIKIVHLDTGYDPRHKACPTYVVKEEEKNFVDADRPNGAEDETPTVGVLVNRGHGTGTLGILAGPKVTDVRPTHNGRSLEG